MEDRVKEYWVSLERRLADLETKNAQLQRDYQRDVTQLTHEVKEVTNRVNHGLSGSVNDVKVDNVGIKLTISELGHSFDKSLGEMKSIVRETADLTKLMVSNFDENKLKPVKEEVGLIKKTFIYGLVGAGIVFMGQKGMNLLWEKVFRAEDKTVIVAPAASIRPGR